MGKFLHKYRVWIILASIGLFAGLYAWSLYAPCDDAYIFLVYAKNWISGNGPTFNGAIVEGFSSPLWLGLITLFGLIGIPLPAVMIALSGLSGLLALWAVTRLTTALTGKREWGLLSALLLAATGDFAFYMGVGLEEVLFAALLALAGAEIIMDTTDSLKTWPLPILLALAILTRPEGALFAVLMLLWGLIASRRFWPAVLTGLKLTALIAPVMVTKRLYYGYWLPNTYYIKSNAGLANLGKGKAYLALNAPRYLPIVAALVILLSAAIWARKFKAVKAALPLLTISAVWGGYVLVSGGDNLVGGRVLIPAIPLVLAAMMTLFSSITPDTRIGLLTIAMLGSVSIFAYAQADDIHEHANRWQRNFPVRQAAGLYLKEKFPTDTLVALNPAGIIPYYSELPTIDMLGLNDEYIGHHGERDFSLDFGHQAGDGAYIMDREPDVILFGGGVAKQPAALLSDRQIAADPRFEAGYKRVTWPGIGYAYVRVIGD